MYSLCTSVHTHAQARTVSEIQGMWFMLHTYIHTLKQKQPQILGCDGVRWLTIRLGWRKPFCINAPNLRTQWAWCRRPFCCRRAWKRQMSAAITSALFIRTRSGLTPPMAVREGKQERDQYRKTERERHWQRERETVWWIVPDYALLMSNTHYTM